KTTRKSGRSRIGRTLSRGQVAERKGFEPLRRLPAYTLSRRAPSTTRPSLRAGRQAAQAPALYSSARPPQGCIGIRFASFAIVHSVSAPQGHPAAIPFQLRPCQLSKPQDKQRRFNAP